MMTEAQRRSLHRCARVAVERGNWTALDAWVNAFDERPRAVAPRETVALQPDGTLPWSDERRAAFDRWERFVRPQKREGGWWERMARLVGGGRA